jgi:Tol biopolymer transport system component
MPEREKRFLTPLISSDTFDFLTLDFAAVGRSGLVGRPDHNGGVGRSGLVGRPDHNGGWEARPQRAKADGSEQRNLTNHPADEADPAWSPDGKQLAFASTRRGGGWRLYVLELSSGKVVELTDKTNRIGHVMPAWSPDGKWIVFGDLVEGGGIELFRCNPKGGERKQLTKLGDNNSEAAWSPDGKKIAFRHFNAAGQGTLYLMSADGSDAKPLLEGASFLIDGITWERR